MIELLFFAICIAIQSSSKVFSAEVPVVLVPEEDVQSTRSCVIEIPSGMVLADSNEHGVIHVKTDNIVIWFKPESISLEVTGGSRQ